MGLEKGDDLPGKSGVVANWDMNLLRVLRDRIRKRISATCFIEALDVAFSAYPVHVTI